MEQVILQLAQLGASGILIFVLYFGLKANARLLEILAEALKSCMEKNASLINQNDELIHDALRRKSSQKETD